MIERRASIVRTTERAEVRVTLRLGGQGATVQSGIPLFDRLLGLLARHGDLGLELMCKAGETDAQGSVEDFAACLGMALAKALGDPEGELRAGHSFSPVEDTLARAVVEISGHPCLVYRVRSSVPSLIDADAGQVERFWRAFVNQARITLHIELVYGSEGLPAFEAIFKAVGSALRDAWSVGSDRKKPSIISR
jgi:imidazoleglycerol-phosphate dehydratase